MVFTKLKNPYSSMLHYEAIVMSIFDLFKFCIEIIRFVT